MSKISLIEKEKKRFYLFNKYVNKYNFLKNIKDNNFNNKFLNFFLNLDKISKIQKLPNNSRGTRIRNRCCVTGRARGVFRRFGLSRFLIRNLSFKGYIPGMVKSC